VRSELFLHDSPKYKAISLYIYIYIYAYIHIVIIIILIFIVIENNQIYIKNSEPRQSESL